MRKNTSAKLKANAQALALIIGFVYLNGESFKAPMAISPTETAYPIQKPPLLGGGLVSSRY
jgi:hypothetical protein